VWKRRIRKKREMSKSHANSCSSEARKRKIENSEGGGKIRNGQKTDIADVRRT
jgi:hypothetical protein